MVETENVVLQYQSRWVKLTKHVVNIDQEVVHDQAIRLEKKRKKNSLS